MSGVPRAVIPGFELTPPLSREELLIAEMERRFGSRIAPGRVVLVEPEKGFAEFGEPRDSLGPSWKKYVLPRPVEDESGEPILGDGSGENQEQARTMWGVGLELKAQRLACCGRFGRRLECIEEQRSFFEPFNCGLRTCQKCAPLLARKLFERLLVLEVVVKKKPGWTLALLDFTLRNDRNLPGVELIRAANLAVKRTMHRLLRGVQGWGYLWIDELGFDNSNLHMHGIYYGPYLLKDKINGVWAEESGGSFVTWIQEVRKKFRAVLWHHLKYVSKPPSNDPRRLAEVEAAFHRVRKVHTLGAFYDPEIGDVSEEEIGGGAQRCPYCGEFLVITSGFCPVSELESVGLVNVNAVRRAVFLQRMGTGPP